MASKYWLKLFHETIYDPKVMMRSPGARLRWYECLCLAGDLDLDGELPSIEHMIFVFRISEEQLLDELSELISAGLMIREGAKYFVKNWIKRQGLMPDDERKRRERADAKKQEYYGQNTSDTRTSRVRNSDVDIDIDKEKEAEEEKEGKKIKKSSAPAASSPQFFDPGWHERIFIQVTQIPGIPGSDLPKVHEALEAMRTRFKTEAEMVGYLRPYFENWINRKTRDGRKYSRSNCAWLYDLALAGDPLPSDVHPPGEKPDPNCPKCKGIGFLASNVKYGDAEFGKLVKCSCLRVREEVPV